MTRTLFINYYLHHPVRTIHTPHIPVKLEGVYDVRNETKMNHIKSLSTFNGIKVQVKNK